MSFGKSVKTEIIANNIAIPVKTPKYMVGIKLDKTSIEKKRRYADRQKQMELAAERGEIHIGKSFK